MQVTKLNLFSYCHKAMLILCLNLYSSVEISIRDVVEQVIYARSTQSRKMYEPVVY